tara:strand:+ start:420 stop:575 length:156 start_codon:yes stop_codon:yes gene_type:complete
MEIENSTVFNPVLDSVCAGPETVVTPIVIFHEDVVFKVLIEGVKAIDYRVH